MTRRRARGRSRDGLFTWDTHGQAATSEIAVNPLLVDCPACGAPARSRCTKPTRRHGGRRETDPHPSRITAALDQRNTPVLPPSAAISATERRS